jgi:hypothetical protein
MAVRERDTGAAPDAPRDPAIDRVYAAGARVEPPAHLDAAILAAARREVRAGPRRPRSILQRWRAPFALSAVLVLSVSVVLLLREEGADRLAESPATIPAPSLPPASEPPADNARTAPQDEQRAAKPRRSQPAAPREDTAARPRDAPGSQAAPDEGDHRQGMHAAPESTQAAPRIPETPRPAPRPFAEPPASPAEPKRTAPEAPSSTDALAKRSASAPAVARQPVERAEREQQAMQQPPAPPAAAATPDAAAGAVAPAVPKALSRPAPGGVTGEQEKHRNDVAARPRPAWQGYESQPPEKWLERVEELRRMGRDAEAREMLAEFRKRFPQHPVPATLDR